MKANVIFSFQSLISNQFQAGISVLAALNGYFYYTFGFPFPEFIIDI